MLQMECGLDLDPGAKILIFIGRWVKQKGVDHIAMLTPVFLRSHQDVQIVLAGPPDDSCGRYAGELLAGLGDEFKGRLFVCTQCRGISWHALAVVGLSTGVDIFSITCRVDIGNLLSVFGRHESTCWGWRSSTGSSSLARRAAPGHTSASLLLALSRLATWTWSLASWEYPARMEKEVRRKVYLVGTPVFSSFSEYTYEVIVGPRGFRLRRVAVKPGLKWTFAFFVYSAMVPLKLRVQPKNESRSKPLVS